MPGSPRAPSDFRNGLASRASPRAKILRVSPVRVASSCRLSPGENLRCVNLADWISPPGAQLRGAARGGAAAFEHDLVQRRALVVRPIDEAGLGGAAGGLEQAGDGIVEGGLAEIQLHLRLRLRDSDRAREFYRHRAGERRTKAQAGFRPRGLVHCEAQAALRWLVALAREVEAGVDSEQLAVPRDPDGSPATMTFRLAWSSFSLPTRRSMEKFSTLQATSMLAQAGS